MHVVDVAVAAYLIGVVDDWKPAIWLMTKPKTSFDGRGSELEHNAK
jgi:hypothetical protein